MKTIGHTNSHNFLVEMEREEYMAFFNLARTMTRDLPWSTPDPVFREGDNLKDVFKALESIVSFKTSIAQLQGLVNHLDILVGGSRSK